VRPVDLSYDAVADPVVPGESEQVAESRKSCFKPAMKSALGSRREECAGPVKEFLWKINCKT